MQMLNGVNLAKLSEETLESETNDHTDLMEEK